MIYLPVVRFPIINYKNENPQSIKFIVYHHDIHHHYSSSCLLFPPCFRLRLSLCLSYPDSVGIVDFNWLGVFRHFFLYIVYDATWKCYYYS